MFWKTSADERSTLTGGCLLALTSAGVTCGLLFVNGSLVMAVLTAVSQTGPSWIRGPQFSQFILFTVPVLLVIAQWMMIDYVRSRLWQRG